MRFRRGLVRQSLSHAQGGLYDRYVDDLPYGKVVDLFNYSLYCKSGPKFIPKIGSVRVLGSSFSWFGCLSIKVI